MSRQTNWSIFRTCIVPAKAIEKFSEKLARFKINSYICTVKHKNCKQYKIGGQNMSLYNMINGVNPATFLILPMLGKHPDEYPRFRDCFVSDDGERIVVYTRVGGNNRNGGYGEEALYEDPNFVTTYDDDEDNTYGYYEFNVPEEWKDDFEKIKNGEKPSDEYIDQMCKVYPKIEDKLRGLYAEKEEK